MFRYGLERNEWDSQPIHNFKALFSSAQFIIDAGKPKPEFEESSIHVVWILKEVFNEVTSWRNFKFLKTIYLERESIP